MKRILDTVHGYIMIPNEFVKYIIDTKYYQRLRRIEQTSIRSVYPSARHDRFIHSLGVFHIGSLIVDHLEKEAEGCHFWGETRTTMMVVFNSYLSACLLHDVGHAPFSHTFEKYYGQKSYLANILKQEIGNERFSSDLDAIREKDEPNYHEYLSAWVTHNKFKDGLLRMNLDLELIVRMITGTFYSIEKDTHQLHNCLISLLHGKVIDADRLDYACRDVWASGYSTSSIDLRRLISALHIKRVSGDYVVCFESNSINEIEGLLNVKDFQVKYVLNHHVVSYEQWLLKQAAECMALKYFPQKEDDNPGYMALQKIINKESIVEEILIPNINVKVSNISDDDLIFLMKQDKDNPYYKEWASRQYTHFALWKSPDEFYHFFPKINRNRSLEHCDFEGVIYAFLKSVDIGKDDVVITKAEYKPRVKMDSLYLVVANDVVRYTDIYPNTKKINQNKVFYYVFVKKMFTEREDIECVKKKILQGLESIITSLYFDKEDINGEAKN